jgi:hypothetical protein
MGLLSLWELVGDSNYAPELDCSPTRPEARTLEPRRSWRERRITTKGHLLNYRIKLRMYQRTPYLIGIVVM